MAILIGVFFLLIIHVFMVQLPPVCPFDKIENFSRNHKAIVKGVTIKISCAICSRESNSTFFSFLFRGNCFTRRFNEATVNEYVIFF